MAKNSGSGDSDVAKDVERQMQNWQRAQGQELTLDPHEPGEVTDFITIANMVGSGGGEIGEQLAEKLGWPVYDRQILSAMAGNDEARTRLYETMDERAIGWFEETLLSFTQQAFHKNDYFNQLTDMLTLLARKGPAIFIGRAADLILPKNKGLRVRLIASLEQRVRNFAMQKEITEAEAGKHLNRISKDRSNFIRQHFNIADDDPTRFDLVIHTERFSTDQAVDLILATREMRKNAGSSNIETV